MDKNAKVKVPAIRFKGFEREWQEQQISQVLEEKQRPIVLNDNQKYELITVKRRNSGVVSRGYLLGKEILVKNYFQLKESDFVVSKRQVVHGATGIVPRNLNNAIVSNEYLVVEDNEKLSTEFLNLLSCLPKMKNDFFLSSYGVDIEKLFFDFEDWRKRLVTIPDKTEQVKLAAFFKQLDTNLELHKAKLNKLNDLKYAMLQKMFPQGDSRVPEVRFAGFEKCWVEKKISDLGKVSTGFPFDSNLFDEDGDLLIITNGNIQDGSYEVDSLTGSKISLKHCSGLESYFLNIDDILVTMDGEVGRTGKVACKDLILAQRVGRLVAFGDTEFLYQALNTGMFYMKMNELSHGGTIKHISLATIGAYTLLVPNSQKEQHKIGSYFFKLDELITWERARISKLKQIKQSCLAGMFV